MKRKDRRRRKSRQHDQGRLPDHRETERLARFERDPMNENARAPSRDTTWCDKSPAPFDVPPLSTTTSHEASAARIARSSADWSSATAPNGTASPPASTTAAAIIAPLLS